MATLLPFFLLLLLPWSSWTFPLAAGEALSAPSLPLVISGALAAAVVVLGAAFIGAVCLCCKGRTSFKGLSRDTTSAGQRYLGGGDGRGAELAIFPPPSPLDDDSPITFEPLPQLQLQPTPLLAAASVDLSAHGGLGGKRLLAFDSPGSHAAADWFDDPAANFPRRQLQYVREVGRGWFGPVVEGRALGLPMGEDSTLTSKETMVVVKILRADAPPTEQVRFLQEARSYRDLRHPCLLQLLARCLEADPLLLVMEACPLGDLKAYLRRRAAIASAQGLPLPLPFVPMAAQISSALAHMHMEGFVHMDLAARNCLVCGEGHVKLGDYGVSVEAYPEDYLRMGQAAIPIRWNSPESLRCSRHGVMEMRPLCSQDNLWSFGVMLWEMLSHGQQPYSQLVDEEVVQRVLVEQPGLQLEPPASVQGLPYAQHLLWLMKQCWLPPSQRPSMEQVSWFLQNLQGNSSSVPSTHFPPHLQWDFPPSEFDLRWNSMRPNRPFSPPQQIPREHVTSAEILWEASPSPHPSLGEDFVALPPTSPSLQNLRGSLEDLAEGKEGEEGPSSISLPATNSNGQPDSLSSRKTHDSDTDDDWRRRLERGEFTEKVREKSRSVQDLMVLTHIDGSDLSDSDSLGASLVFTSEGHLCRGREEEFLQQLEALQAKPASTPTPNLTSPFLGKEAFPLMIDKTPSQSLPQVIVDVATPLAEENPSQEDIVVFEPPVQRPFRLVYHDESSVSNAMDITLLDFLAREDFSFKEQDSQWSGNISKVGQSDVQQQVPDRCESTSWLPTNTGDLCLGTASPVQERMSASLDSKSHAFEEAAFVSPGESNIQKQVEENSDIPSLECSPIASLQWDKSWELLTADKYKNGLESSILDMSAVVDKEGVPLKYQRSSTPDLDTSSNGLDLDQSAQDAFTSLTSTKATDTSLVILGPCEELSLECYSGVQSSVPEEQEEKLSAPEINIVKASPSPKKNATYFFSDSSDLPPASPLKSSASVGSRVSESSSERLGSDPEASSSEKYFTAEESPVFMQEGPVTSVDDEDEEEEERGAQVEINANESMSSNQKDDQEEFWKQQMVLLQQEAGKAMALMHEAMDGTQDEEEQEDSFWEPTVTSSSREPWEEASTTFSAGEEELKDSESIFLDYSQNGHFPLSPIMEESESSLASGGGGTPVTPSDRRRHLPSYALGASSPLVLEDLEVAGNGDTHLSSVQQAEERDPYEDILFVDTETHEAKLVESGGQVQAKRAEDKSKVKEEDEEEEETSYTPDWESESEEDEDGGEDGSSSSTSGEFEWREGDWAQVPGSTSEGPNSLETPGEPTLSYIDFPMESIAEEVEDEEVEGEDGEEGESESGEEEFVPSQWRVEATPQRSSMRSPDKGQPRKKSVSFKQQRHHRVYEYPREEAPLSPPTPTSTSSIQHLSLLPGPPTSTAWSDFATLMDYSQFADWELGAEEIPEEVLEMDPPEMLNGNLETTSRNLLPSFNIYQLSDVDPGFGEEDSDTAMEEFLVRGSSRPFPFFSASEFFPGSSHRRLETGDDGGEGGEELAEELLDSDYWHSPSTTATNSTTANKSTTKSNNNSNDKEASNGCSQAPTAAVGELRHTRDRLKLELPQRYASSHNQPSTDVPNGHRHPDDLQDGEEMEKDGDEVGMKLACTQSKGEAVLLDSCEELSTGDSGVGTVSEETSWLPGANSNDEGEMKEEEMVEEEEEGQQHGRKQSTTRWEGLGLASVPS